MFSYNELKMIVFALHITMIIQNYYDIKYYYSKILKEKAPIKEKILLIADKEHLPIIAFSFLSIIINLIFIFNMSEHIPIYYYKIIFPLMFIFSMLFLRYISRNKIK